MLDTYNVIRFEQRGCGRSVCDGRYDLSTAVYDIEHIRQFYGIENWIVCGHSWGANLAFVYAMEYPERVRALMYIAGNGIHNDQTWNETYRHNRDGNTEVMPEMPYPLNAAVNIEGNRSLREFGRSPDFWLRVSKMKVPALFIEAGSDIRPNWPPMQMQRLMPNAEWITIENASHYIWLDDPDRLRSVMLDWLAFSLK